MVFYLTNDDKIEKVKTLKIFGMKDCTQLEKKLVNWKTMRISEDETGFQ